LSPIPELQALLASSVLGSSDILFHLNYKTSFIETYCLISADSAVCRLPETTRSASLPSHALVICESGAYSIARNAFTDSQTQNIRTASHLIASTCTGSTSPSLTDNFPHGNQQIIEFVFTWGDNLLCQTRNLVDSPDMEARYEFIPIYDRFYYSPPLKSFTNTVNSDSGTVIIMEFKSIDQNTVLPIHFSVSYDLNEVCHVPVNNFLTFPAFQLFLGTKPGISASYPADIAMQLQFEGLSL
jgi:hypothetical protein